MTHSTTTGSPRAFAPDQAANDESNGARSSQRQRATTATIRIRDLRLRTFIGFNPEERSKQQDIVINIEIKHTLNPGVFSDDVDSALNYKTITKTVIEHVENGRFLLLEKLVSDVLDISSRDEAVQFAQVCIEKPHALRFADSVSVTLEYSK